MSIKSIRFTALNLHVQNCQISTGLSIDMFGYKVIYIFTLFTLNDITIGVKR